MRMKKVMALILSSAMICAAVPAEVLAAEEVPAEFSDNVDEENSDTLEMPETDISDSDEGKISEVELQLQNEEANEKQDADFEDEGNMLSDGDDFNDGNVASAEESGQSGNIQWELEDSDDDGFEDTLIINGSGDMPDYKSYDEQPWYAYRNTISHLIIEDGITSIGSYTFKLPNLQNIEWGENITKIGSYTLNDCEKITEINLPKNITSIGAYTFWYWKSLESIDIPNDVKVVGSHAFYGCTNLQNVNFSENVEEIGEYAFAECSKVKNIFLPVSLKKIGRGFFEGRKKYYSQSYLGCTLSRIHYSGTKEDLEKIDGINERDHHPSDPSTLRAYVHYSVYHKPKQPTCLKKGFDGYWICNSCGGKAYKDANCMQELEQIPSTPALGHALDFGIIIKESSCAEEGSILYTCQREGCGYTETKAIPKTQNHIYGNASYIWSSNNKECTAKKYCTICDNEEAETVETQKIIIKPATCTEDGILQYNAIFTKECFEAQQKKKNIDSLNHQNTEIKNKKEATCNEEGYSGDTYCKDCGLLLSKGETIPETGHTWNAGTRTKEPTCTENGELVYACKICGKTKSEEIPAVGHKAVIDEAVAPTCEESGKTEGSHCSLCGIILKAQEEIPATGHKEVIDKAVAATCERAGKAEGSHCSVCGTIIKAQMEVPATGHNWISGNTIKEPTCEKAGQKEYYCSVCWKTKVENIPTTGHKWSNAYTVVKNETCTEPGERYIQCINCGAIKEGSVETIPAWGHALEKDKGFPATCETAGMTDGSHCVICDAIIKKQEKIPAKGHTFTETKTISNATVLAAAKKEYECSVCGFKEIRSVGNKLKATMKVSTSKIAMKPQQKITSLKVTYTKGDSVASWKIANTKLVKVTGKANGTCVLTAGKLGGTTTLTIKLKSGLIKKVSITVNVKTQQITGVSSKITLVKGQYITIKPKLYPATSTDKITYKSNNSVVSVNSNGEIHARKKGTAVVTVKSGNKSVKIQITVEDPKFSKTSLSLDVKQTYQLKISGTSQKIKWSSDNNSIASVSSTGKVTAKKQGKTTIRACVGNSKFSCKVSIKKAILTPKLEAILSSKTKTSTSVIVMSVKNNGDRTLRINSNAALLDRDYDKFDRDLRLIDEDTIMPISYLDIAPGKSKFVVFEVIGNRTWYDKKSTIVYQFKYRNKTYKIASSSYYGTYFIK